MAYFVKTRFCKYVLLCCKKRPITTDISLESLHKLRHSTFIDATSRYGENDTHFGNRTVSEKDKAKLVRDVFENVANSYDNMNDVMSIGIHRLWKDALVTSLAPTPQSKIIDVAGGTGDIAFRIAKFSKTESGSDCGANITVCDISESMLGVGKARAAQQGIDGVSWVCGDAECLPFDSNTFDAYTIAFGIRNCVHVDKVVREAHRVLRPGGRFLCLEFSRVDNPVLSRLYDAYSYQVIPVLGQVIARDWHSYKYLVESIRKFPSQDAFSAIIRDSGFRFVHHENMTFGVACIHSGFKL